MKRFALLTILIIACATQTVRSQGAKNIGQTELPYFEIPIYPEKYSAGTVCGRIIDGLGFRFYWATEGLRDEDLRFKPGVQARTSLETITHIYELSLLIVNATNQIPNIIGAEPATLSFAEMRKKTLLNLKSASDRLKTISDKEFEGLKIVFKRDTKISEFPFWNELNGPIADAIWHVGQVVSFRRSSGNPFDEKANVFTGKWTE